MASNNNSQCGDSSVGIDIWFQNVCRLSLQGRLNELMSQIRMQNHFGAVRSEERYSVDADLLREIKQVRHLWIVRLHDDDLPN